MATAEQTRSAVLRIVIPVLLLLYVGAACKNDGASGDKELDETEIASIVGETLAAEDLLTAQAFATETYSALSAPGTEIVSVQQTINAQQATLDAQATLINQPIPSVTENQDPQILPSETSIPTDQVSLDPISLVDWKLNNMVQAPGCGEDKNGPPCWFGSKSEMSITSLKPIFIDPSWPNPYLVFSHRYVFVHDATIYVNIKGGWEILWSFPAGQSTPWVPFTVDLSKFKGEEIMIQMHAAGSSSSQSGKVRTSSWDIRDPQIIPDFSKY
jgi:hypothetical protein